jgi:hypothetical protein
VLGERAAAGLLEALWSLEHNFSVGTLARLAVPTVDERRAHAR